MYLFLFSLKQLSSCRYSTSGNFSNLLSIQSNRVVVKLLLCGHSIMSTNTMGCIPFSPRV